MRSKIDLSVACLIDGDIAEHVRKSDSSGGARIDWARATRHERIRAGHDLSVVQALRRLYRAVHIVSTEQGGIETAAGLRPDVIFNLAFSAHPLEPSFAGCLDLLDIPYTGSGPLGIALSRDKIRSRHLMRAAGVPVPNFVELRPGCPVTADLRPPLIVKPVSLASSVGIYTDSVVEDPSDVPRLAKRIWDRFGVAAVCEEFIVGREFRFGVVEDARGEMQVSGVCEYRFGKSKPGWGYRTEAIRASRQAAEVRLISRSIKQAGDRRYLEYAAIGRKAAAALDVCGYATVDLRLDADGCAVVLEVNANPGIKSGSSMWRHPSFYLNIKRMVEAALRRKAR